MIPNAARAPNPAVGVVFVTLNAVPYVVNALDAVRNQSYPSGAVQTILIDNGSTDHTIDLVRERFPWVRTVAELTNRGFAGGSNIGMRSVAADYYALINPDAVIAPDWLTVLVAAMEADLTIGVAGSKILYGETNIIQHAGGMVRDNASTYHLGDGEPDSEQYNRCRDVDYVMGAALLMRGDLARQLGYLPEEYYPAYFEETDFCAQVRRIGKRVVYIPDAVARHFDAKRPPYNDLPLSFLLNYHQNRYLYALRNMRTPEQKRKFREAERTLRSQFKADKPTRLMLRTCKWRNWRRMLRHPWLFSA
jgi:GT2 family glycosyltransferase